MSKLLEVYQGLDLETIVAKTNQINTCWNLGMDWCKERGQGEAVFDQQDQFRGLSLNELRKLGLNILGCRNVFEGYELIAQTPQDGESTYYDRIIGPQHKRSYRVLEQGLARFPLLRSEKGLDVATGTGETALILAKHCKNVIAIDLSPPMLQVADKKLEALASQGLVGSFQTRVMDCLELDFPDGYFDMVVGNGIAPYLTNEEQQIHYREIYRVLRPGGRLYKYAVYADYAKKEADALYCVTPRAFLASMAVAALLAFSLQADRSHAVFIPEGLKFNSFGVEFDNQDGPDQITIWEKPYNG